MAYFRNSDSFKWKVIRKIGSGGNGTVYEVLNEKGDHFALKELSRVKNNKSYRRFRDEIKVLGLLREQDGIMQIVDSYLPKHFKRKDKPFYVMPKGIPLQEYLQDKSHEELYKIFIQICKALQHLHGKGITHRDIKPANILFVNGKPVLADFGLANFPKKEKVSSPDEIIGPRWTIAPEMQRISSTAEYKKADIYSLAKTLWIFITGKAYGFEGQYIPESNISIDKHIELAIDKPWLIDDWGYFSIVLLEKLMIDSTSNGPEERPHINEFIQRLEYWLHSNTAYEERNPYEWENAIKRIFPYAIPEHCEWKGIDDIISILKILTRYDNLNHMFYPDHGGDDLKSIELSKVKGCIQIMEDNLVTPGVLTFDMIDELNWSYFRLDVASVEPMTNAKGFVEDVYVSEMGNYSIYPDPGCIEMRRYLTGAFIFIFKTSVMNSLPGELDGYMGTHSKMTASEYRRIITQIKEMMESQ